MISRPTPARALAVLTAGCAAALALGQGQASAQVVREQRDFPIERFRWTFSRTGVLGAEWGAPAPTGSWDAGLWLGTANDPLVLLGTDGEGARSELAALVAQRTAAALLVSYAWRRVELGLELPLIVAQSRGERASGVNGALTSISGAGLGDLRLAPKLGLLAQGRHGVDLALLASVTVPTGAEADYRGERGPSLAPEVALSRTQGRWRGALDLGYRLRRNTTLLDLEVKDELFGVAALGRGVGARGELAAALAWATAAESPLGADNQDYLEAQLGVTWGLGPLALSGIVGAGAASGFGTPDWRAVLAVRFGATATAPSDLDHDGVVGAADACPRDAEDLDGWNDLDGCPDLDDDGDGIADLRDAAPRDAEDLDGWNDLDGAPERDNDGDGIADAHDRCPDQPEVTNHWLDDDGCPDDADRDHDSVLDTPEGPDVCLTAAEDLDGWQDLDGCPDFDDDDDGVADSGDRCPRLAGAAETAGCPDPDRDSDGLVDRLDNCPREKGPLGFHGCARRQRVALVAGKLELLESVRFATGSDRILRRSFPLLDNVAAVLLAHPELERVRVEGHTDARGPALANLALSQRRAAAVVRYLTARGPSLRGLGADGFGESQPIADNRSAAGRARNRRVEIRLAAPEPPALVPPGADDAGGQTRHAASEARR